MRIGNGFDYLTHYNDYNVSRLRSELINNGTLQSTEDPGANATSSDASKAGVVGKYDSSEVKRQRLLGLEDVSLSFNKNDDFELIGSTSDITSLDIDKALSDVKKDDILSQYRQGEKSIPVYDGEDGTVIAK